MKRQNEGHSGWWGRCRAKVKAVLRPELDVVSVTLLLGGGGAERIGYELQ